MIVLQTIHIVLTIVSILGITGWVFSYVEYKKRKSEQEFHMHTLEVTKQDADETLIRIESEHQNVVYSYEEKLKSLTDIREADIVEAEELVKAKIEEIERVYREVLNDQNDSLELYESYIKNFDAVITAVDSRLKELDDKGMFAVDDEIGFFFNYVKSLQSILGKFKEKKEELDNSVLESKEKD